VGADPESRRVDRESTWTASHPLRANSPLPELRISRRALLLIAAFETREQSLQQKRTRACACVRWQR
jgi:hypothetical protein